MNFSFIMLDKSFIALVVLLLIPRNVIAVPDFKWSHSGPISGMKCTQILEGSDSDSWNDNYLCIPKESTLELQWSYSGPVSDMKCTQIIEGSDPDTWNDNYLCIPKESTLELQWSYSGPVSGMQCTQINEPSEPKSHTWNDNYVCYNKPPVPTLEQFIASTYREPGTGIYIIDGDIPVKSQEELKKIYTALVKSQTLPDGRKIDTQYLVVDQHIEQGIAVDSKWSDSQRKNITYCVSNEFGDNHDTVMVAMAQSSSAWSAAADVSFRYMSASDAACDNKNNDVVFDVRPVTGAPYLARAFFPNDLRSDRELLIDGSSFATTPPLTITGILRHELGHTLGFRHEHTRPEAGICFEDNNWRPLTPYDKNSVMHYPQCNGSGSWLLELTTMDEEGIRNLYSGPSIWNLVDSALPKSETGWRINGVGDFNGDGKDDLVWRRSDDSGEARIWLLDGARLLGDSGLPPGEPGWRINGVGDFNGDNKDDLVWRRSDDSGEAHIWLLNGGQLLRDSGLPLGASGWRINGVGDFNGDNKDDLVWRRSDDSGEARIWLLDEAQLLKDVGLPSSELGWRINGVGDFNGDGKDDLVWRRSDDSGEARLWLLDGGQLLKDSSLPKSEPGWRINGVGDFNGDNKDDLVWRRSDDSGEARIWLLDGARLLEDSGLPSSELGWRINGVGDFNGDGKAQLVWRRSNDSGEARLWHVTHL
jgi:hypothetical protein